MLRSLLLLAVLTLTWGVNWAVLKIGVSQLPPLWFRAIGLAIGAGLLGSALAVRGASFRIPRGSLPRIVGLSVPNIMIWYAVVTEALTMLPAGRAAILGFTMPAWSAAIGVLVYRQPLDGRSALGVAAAIAGVILLVAGDWAAMAAQPLGVGLMLFAACAWAWGTHLLKRADLAMPTLVLTFWMMAVAVPVLFGASALLEFARWRLPVGSEWGPILYNAALVLAIGNVIWFTLARTLPPTTAGLSSMLIPAVGVFSGMAILGETPSWLDFAALALVSVAVGVAVIPVRKRRGTP